MERKEFRQDLYFRLNVVPVPVPALRERMEDVPPLAQGERTVRGADEAHVHVVGHQLARTSRRHDLVEPLLRGREVVLGL